jgi:hypothetical protein
MRKKNTDS